MTVELTDEQEAFRKVVRDFATTAIAPHAEAWDRDHHFPVDTVLAMGELGLFGLPFPEEYGGGGGDLTTLCVAIEETPGSTSRWPSPSRPASASGPTRSTLRYRGAAPDLAARPRAPAGPSAASG